MNHYNLQENAFMGFEDSSISAPIFDYKDARTICPKPRRVGAVSTTPLRSLRWNMSHHDELNDSKAGMELLDIILKKECNVEEQLANHGAPSPPRYFCGSPPTRAANPLILDSRFGDENLTSMSLLGIPSPSCMSSPTSTLRKGGCVRVKFGLKPAAVRVEGFDCLNRDRQNSSIAAFA